MASVASSGDVAAAGMGVDPGRSGPGSPAGSRAAPAASGAPAGEGSRPALDPLSIADRTAAPTTAGAPQSTAGRSRRRDAGTRAGSPAGDRPSASASSAAVVYRA